MIFISTFEKRQQNDNFIISLYYFINQDILLIAFSYASATSSSLKSMYLINWLSVACLVTERIKAVGIKV